MNKKIIIAIIGLAVIGSALFYGRDEILKDYNKAKETNTTAETTKKDNKEESTTKTSEETTTETKETSEATTTVEETTEEETTTEAVVMDDVTDEAWFKDLTTEIRTNKLVVLNESAGSTGILYMFERGEDRSFKQILSFDVYGGVNGFGKMENADGRTPVGMFTIRNSFGFDADNGYFNYTGLDNSYYWCLDPNSDYYNSLISVNKSSEFNGDISIYFANDQVTYKLCADFGYNISKDPSIDGGILIKTGNAPSNDGSIILEYSDFANLLKNLDADNTFVINTKDMIS